MRYELAQVFMYINYSAGDKLPPALCIFDLV